MTRRPARADFDSAQGKLRTLLHAWDPIGVFQDDDPEMHAPADEYDCLIPGLYQRLWSGEREDEVRAFLEEQLVEHFGLTPRPQADGKFARELVAWWSGRGQRQGAE